MADYSKAKAKKEDEKIFARLKKRFTECNDATLDVRKFALDDIRFSAGEQWSEALLQERKGRPCLTINKIEPTLNQVGNEHRLNPASIKYRPFDSATDPDKAEILNGLVRHIMNNTNSTQAMNKAFDYAISGSFGFFRVVTCYRNENSFDQEILVKPIKNPLSVYFPLHLINEADYSDAPYAFIRSKISKDEFEERWPKMDVDSFEQAGEGDDTQWKTEDSVFIVEYFEVEEKPKKIYLVTDGQNKSTVEDITNLPDGFTVIDERDSCDRTIKWYTACGGGILETRDWAGKYIPIIPIVGKEVNIEGKITILSLTRIAKDAQRLFNYWQSLTTEMIALQPKVPFIDAAGQFEGHEEWKTAHQKNYPYLEYEIKSAGGVLAPPPSRPGPIGLDTGIVTALRQSADDIKALTNVYDASLGARGNETSGVAINSRQRQGITGNYHFQESALLATTYLGRIFLDLIPKIYDTQRMIRILGDDMQMKTAQITDGYFDDVADYDVIVDTSPDYSTKRTEIVQTLSSLNQSSPMFAELNGDYIANNLDIDGAKELADRMRKFINMKYPGLIQEQGGQGQGMSEQEVQSIIAELQKLQQQLQAKTLESQQMEQVIAKMQAVIDDKEADRQNRIEVAQINAAAGIDKAKITTNPKDTQVSMEMFDRMTHGTEPERISETQDQE